MTAKNILALAQAHRKEPSKANYDALADAVRKLEAERDAAVEARAYLVAPEQSEPVSKRPIESDFLKFTLYVEALEKYADQKAHQASTEPVGYLFNDDPKIFAMPGSGFSHGSTPPDNAVNITPVYPTAQPTELINSIKQEAETGLVIGDEIGMRDALQAILNYCNEHLGITV